MVQSANLPVCFSLVKKKFCPVQDANILAAGVTTTRGPSPLISARTACPDLSRLLSSGSIEVPPVPFQPTAVRIDWEAEGFGTGPVIPRSGTYRSSPCAAAHFHVFWVPQSSMSDYNCAEL